MFAQPQPNITSNIKAKINLCKNWNGIPSSCRFGFRCRYDHFCSFFSGVRKEYCNKGKHCQYVHLSMEEIREIKQARGDRLDSFPVFQNKQARKKIRLIPTTYKRAIKKAIKKAKPKIILFNSCEELIFSVLHKQGKEIATSLTKNILNRSTYAINKKLDIRAVEKQLYKYGTDTNIHFNVDTSFLPSHPSFNMIKNDEAKQDYVFELSRTGFDSVILFSVNPEIRYDMFPKVIGFKWVDMDRYSPYPSIISFGIINQKFMNKNVINDFQPKNATKYGFGFKFEPFPSGMANVSILFQNEIVSSKRISYVENDDSVVTVQLGFFTKYDKMYCWVNNSLLPSSFFAKLIKNKECETQKNYFVFLCLQGNVKIRRMNL